MRVAIVTESFLPQVNGVTNSVLRVCEQLHRHGHEAVVVAPGGQTPEWPDHPVVRVPSRALPGYADHQIALPWPGLEPALRRIGADVIHLASPLLLGTQAVRIARGNGWPTLAVYQTDIAGFAQRYRLRLLKPVAESWIGGLHRQVDLTLAPSRQAIADLAALGVPRVAYWPRGVDAERFHPAHRDPGLRRRLAPDGQLLIGYVGRLAREKQVELMAGLDQLPGVRLVIVGDGPQRRRLQALLPGAVFLGQLGGRDLSAAFASLDVFVHAGAHETFCQAVQEALASGVPVVAPAAGGPADLVDDGRTGRLFRPGSAPDLQQKVKELIDDPVTRARYALQARRAVADRSWDAMGDQLMQHYDRVRSGAGVTARAEAGSR